MLTNRFTLELLLLARTLTSIQSFAKSPSLRTRIQPVSRIIPFFNMLEESVQLGENDPSNNNKDVNTDLSLAHSSDDYINSMMESHPDWTNMLQGNDDPLWQSVKLEAMQALGPEPEAGPQLYQGIISQPSLLDALVTIISHEIETELIPATEVKNLCLKMLTAGDAMQIRKDVVAAAMRSRSIGSALQAMLFHKGLHALACYRVAHKLWLAGRTGLAYYMQSTVSREFMADIHPAARMGCGIFLNCGSGVVIGETAVVGNDVTILQGVTLGGTGKEAGDRHPKVGNGVVLHNSATVLGNIPVGNGAIITAKSIVTKPVPPLAIMSGVPATIQGYRKVDEESLLSNADEYEQDLGFKYAREWQELTTKREQEEEEE